MTEIAMILGGQQPCEIVYGPCLQQIGKTLGILGFNIHIYFYADLAGIRQCQGEKNVKCGLAFIRNPAFLPEGTNGFLKTGICRTGVQMNPADIRGAVDIGLNLFGRDILEIGNETLDQFRENGVVG